MTCLVLLDKLLTLRSENQRVINMLHAEQNCRRLILTTDKKTKGFETNAFMCLSLSDGNRVIIIMVCLFENGSPGV